MSSLSTAANPARLQRGKRRITPAGSGAADPRPLTTYTATLSTVGGHSRITVVLDQPCVIRHPAWPLIDCVDGSRINPTGFAIVSNTAFQLDYAGLIADSVAFVYVPPQDMEVQNFRGGFPSPGGQWFRKPS